MSSTLVPPSGTPAAAAPGNSAAQIPPAPSAAASATPQPLTLADYDRLASQSLQANETPISPAAPERPAVVPGKESPPEPTPTVPGTSDNMSAAQAAEPPAPPVADAEEDPEPTPEELAGLGEAGKRALQAERQKRKDARAENAELRQRLDALEAKLNPPPPPAAEPIPAPAAAPVAPVYGLEDCQTFEAVDARAMQAVSTEATVLRLQRTLARNGVDAVVPLLKAEKVEQIDGVPVEQAGEEAISEFLSGVYEKTRLDQVQAEPRKQFLANRARNFQSAAQIVPEILDAKTDQAKLFNNLMREQPILRSLPNGPELAAKLILGHEVFTSRKTKTATNPPPVPLTPAPQPTPKSAPAAPRRSSEAIPQISELDTLRAKLAAGTATTAEVDRYSALALG